MDFKSTLLLWCLCNFMVMCHSQHDSNDSLSTQMNSSSQPVTADEPKNKSSSTPHFQVDPGITSNQENNNAEVNDGDQLYTVNQSLSDYQATIDAYSFACGKDSFCNNSLSETSPLPECVYCYKCSCEMNCSLTRNCCPDIENTVVEKTSAWKCVRRLSMVDIYNGGPVYQLMVQSCKTGIFHDETIRRCLEGNGNIPAEIIPATDLSTGITYRNIFCALCNEVTNVSTWQLQVNCSPFISNSSSKFDIWQNIRNSSECRMATVPPDGVELESCIGESISTCSETYPNDTKEWRLCHEGHHGPPLEVYGIVFENIFCALCNNEIISEECYHSRVPLGFFDGYGLQVLLDFNPRSSEQKEEESLPELSEKFNCSRNQAYNPFTEACADIRCPPKWVLAEGNCEPLFSSSSGQGYRLQFLSLTDKPLGGWDLSHVIWSFESRILQLMSEAFYISLFTGSFRDIRSNSFLDNEPVYIGFLADFNVSTLSDVNQSFVERSLRELANTSFNLILPYNMTLTLEVTSVPDCSNTIESFIGNGFIQTDVKPASKRLYDCPVLDCSLNYTKLFDSPNCPHINVNLTTIPHSYNVLTNNLTIIVHVSRSNITIWLQPNSHVYCNGVLKVCTDSLAEILEILNKGKTGTPDRGMDILTQVCLILSLFCLFITFLVFCYLPQLRSLPGKNTMALMFHLFCAQLLFLTGISAVENEIVCQILAVLIHYFWLMTYFWMATCAFHMCRLFSTISLPASSKSHIKTLVKYSIVCHMLTIVCIAVCIGYHLIISNGHLIGYGREDLCFLTEPMDIGIFFAGPLGVVLVFNLVCFIITVRAIRSVPRIESSHNQTNRSHVQVYFRLSILLGFTWVFGFIAAGLQNNVLWYIFIVLNGLQGVFISLAYCATKRTSNMLKDRISETSVFSFMTASHSTALENHSTPSANPAPFKHKIKENHINLLSFHKTDDKEHLNGCHNPSHSSKPENEDSTMK